MGVAFVAGQWQEIKTSIIATTMARDEAMELVGTVTQVLPGLLFRVALPNGQEVLAEVRGKMRTRFVRISVGDTVNLEMFPHDADKAWITFKEG